MELVIFVRLVWRWRLQVAVGAVLGLAIAAVMGGTPVVSSGVAATRVLVDTPRSAVIANAPNGSDTLAWRATLLAMLMGTDPAREQLARETGVPVNRIAVSEPELTSAINPAALPVAAIGAADATSEPYVLTVATDDVLPIVSVEATGPDRAQAARLVAAAVHTLQAGASPRDTPQLQGLSITQMDPLAAVEVQAGGGHKSMIETAVGVFALWCVGLAVWARRRKRRGHGLIARALATRS